MRITFTRLHVKLDRERLRVTCLTCFQFTVQSKIITHVVILCVLKLLYGNENCAWEFR